MQKRGQHPEGRPACSSRLLPGQQWSLQAQRWGDEALPEPQQKAGASTRPSQTEPSSSEPDFKLVGRCELREDTRVCFSNPSFGPRPPFPSPPPPLHPASCRQEKLWSRGLPSLGAVTQLRVTMPFGGAASALGFKALVVWGQPARCCSAEELERVKRTHEACERQPPSPGLFVPPVSQREPSVSAVMPLRLVCGEEALKCVQFVVVCDNKKFFPDSSADPVPDDFLDPITQEVMVLPMLLPSGVSVDNSTLEEHQKREATWGRAPNDPFTGVPFTSTSRPVPNPQLKGRIDRFLLKNGMTGMSRRLGRGGDGEQPQTSRLVASQMDPSTLESSCNNSSSGQPAITAEADPRDPHVEEHPAGATGLTSRSPPPAAAGWESPLEPGNKRHLNGEAEDRPTAASQPAKRRRGDAGESSESGITTTTTIERFLCQPP